ncbi:MAG: glycoside hydrolase family 2 protein [Phycisphaerae bacterium]
MRSTILLSLFAGFFACFMVGCDAKKAASPAKEIDLSGEWQISSADGEHKLTGKLPGDVHSALLAAGIIENPYYGTNEDAVQWVSETDWIYSRTFSFSPQMLSRKVIVLEVDGPDTICSFRVNGELIGESRDMFNRYRFDIKPVIRQGVNNIEISFHSPRAEARELIADYDPALIKWSTSMDEGFNLIRKAQCQGGWDWGTNIPSCGVMNSIKVIAAESQLIKSVTTRQSFTGNSCDVIVHAELDGATEAELPVVMELAGKKKAFTLAAGDYAAEAKFTIESPKLWWPAGYGEQNLYELKVSLSGSSIEKKIGLREAELISEDDEHGRSMGIRVNGVDVFSKGANWIPVDALAMNQTPERYEHLLRSAAEANMNMIRVWGGGYYERDIFYELCDELGLMVFQDMMFACSMYPADDAFLELVADEMRYQAGRLCDHPSVVLWSGENECLNGALNWYSGDRYPDARANWQKLNDTRRDALLSVDKSRTYWPSSPSNGIGNEADRYDSFSKGDTHSWEVWHGNKPFEHYYSVQPRFCSEFGFQSFPSMETIKSFAPEDEWALESPAMLKHQKNANGNNIIANNFKRYFHEPKDFESMVYLSQLQQALAIKTGAEYWRSIKPVCQGVLYWQLNDNWPVASWSSIENNGNWKQLHYQAKRFFEPVMSCVIKQGDNFQLHLVSDLAADVDVDIELAIYDLAGKPIETKAWSVTAAPQSAELIEAIAADSLPAGSFALLTTTRNSAEPVIETVLFTEPKNYELPEANVSAEVGRMSEGAIPVTLTTDKPAFYVVAGAEGIKGHFSDNSITLLPGQSRTILFYPDGETTAEQLRAALKTTDLRASY